MTKFIGLLGYPLKHSISPQFQQAALDYLELGIRYEAWEVVPAELVNRVDKLRSPEILGANVTVPYKETVLPLIDEVDPMAGQIGAVNTIVNRQGRLAGYNTDALGFIRALQEEGGFEPKGKRAVILGAGGVARAAVFVLVREGAASIALVDIVPQRAETLASELKQLSSGMTALRWGDERLSEALHHSDLVVNCTPVGMKHSASEGQSPLEARYISSKALVYDLVYNPEETPLLQEAKRAGASTLGGLPMLVYQGAASLEIWTGKKAPLDIMFEAARRALS